MQSLRCAKSQQLSQDLCWNKIPGDLHGHVWLGITALKITDVSHLILNVLKVFTCTLEAQRTWKIGDLWSGLDTRSFKTHQLTSVCGQDWEPRPEGSEKDRDGHYFLVIGSLIIFPDSKSSAHSATPCSLTLIRQISGGAMCTDQAFFPPCFFPFFLLLKQPPWCPWVEVTQGQHYNCLLMSNWWLMDLPSAEALPLTANAWCGAGHPPGGDQYSIMEAAG